MPKTDSPRSVSAPALERLAAWSRRRPRIALLGEFSSGKSTLLNLLLGAELLPTRVTATELPPVWISHGPPGGCWTDAEGRRHPLDPGRLGEVPKQARHVRISLPAPRLERCDLVDTPGISDPNIEADLWRHAVGLANFVLWCTPATQAWRETERSTWAMLPERLRADSVLVVTRSDKLSEPDREKVARRLARESEGLFGSVVFLSAPEAIQGRALMAETGDSSLWVRSGGAELEARLRAGIAAVRSRRAAMLDRYVSDGTGTRPGAAVLPLLRPPRDEVRPEPVRPRRIELPESPRRTERPVPDPLDAIRAGWQALRRAEAEPADEPDAPLPDQPDLECDEAAWPEPAISDPAPEAQVVPGPGPQSGPASTDTDAALASVLSAMAETAAPPAAAEEAAPDLPRAVRIWRDIVQRTPGLPPESPIPAMIDQLLIELSREEERSTAKSEGPAAPGRIWAA